jgi:hypothetical protein
VEAARWFTLRTDPLIPKIESFKAGMQATNAQVEEAAGRAERAFDEVEKMADR